jgi:hypothetical protein
MRSLLGPSSVVLLTGSGSCVAVVTGEARPPHLQAPAAPGGVTILETETASFVEPVVLTH